MRKTPLKRVSFLTKKKIPLRKGYKSEPRKISFLAKAPLRKVSKKQAKENALWSKIKKERRDLLIAKFGYLPCEWCKTRIVLNHPDLHHNDRNRRNNTLTNARVLHRLCHTFVTDNNIKDVPDLLKNNFQKSIDKTEIVC